MLGFPLSHREELDNFLLSGEFLARAVCGTRGSGIATRLWCEVRNSDLVSKISSSCAFSHPSGNYSLSALGVLVLDQKSENF